MRDRLTTVPGTRQEARSAETTVTAREGSTSFSFPNISAPRDLHSFPTRRSSDLAVRLSIMRPTLTGVKPSTSFAGQRDRKSTRLNSSHRCISYAVFCLKKKNHTANITHYES